MASTCELMCCASDRSHSSITSKVCTKPPSCRCASALETSLEKRATTFGWSERRAWRSASRSASIWASCLSAGISICFTATRVPVLSSLALYTRAMPPSANISSTSI